MPYDIPEWISSIPARDKNKLENAVKAQLTPIEFDAESGYAEFSGRHGYYRTTLTGCRTKNGPCGGGYPCKHMYRLAMQLGLIPGDCKNDLSKITYQRFGIPLPDAIARVESVSKEAQKFLFRWIRHLRYNSLEVEAVPSEIFAELEAAKLLIRIDDPAEIRMHPDIDKSSYKLYLYMNEEIRWRF